ncbi:MAG: hypothetical protein ACP5NO_07600 [Thermoplasmata archaeon]
MKERSFELLVSLAVVAIGVVARLIPDIIYHAWGNDFGIYYYLSNALIKGASIFNLPAAPWGHDGYQYFPVTYVIVLIAHTITGATVFDSLSYSVPILGGLTPYLLYLIARRSGLERATSFLASMFLVVNPAQAYQTSQPNYLTTGHFFLLLSIFLFIEYHKDKRFYFTAIASSFLLVLSHSLSSYIFVISLFGMVISWNLFEAKAREYLNYDIALIIFSGTFLISYYLWRIPAMPQIFSNALLELGISYIILLFYLLVLVTFLILRSPWAETGRRYMRLLASSLKQDVGKNVLLVSTGIISILFIVTVMKIVGYIPAFITWSALGISLPYFIFLALAVIGIKYTLTDRRLYPVLGWTMAILLSLLYSVATNNSVILTARYFEYLAESGSIIAAFVIVDWYRRCRSATPEKNKLQEEKSDKYPRRRQIAGSKNSDIFNAASIKSKGVIVFAVALITLTGAMAYPMMSYYIPSHTESLTDQDASVLNFLMEHGNRSFSVATDHQVGMILASYGFYSPFNNLSKFWSSTNWTQALYQMSGMNGSFPPVVYVLITSSMLQYGIWGYNGENNPNQPPIYMNNSSLGKFFRQPFVLMFSNGSGAVRDRSYLFEVNWTYVTSHINLSFKERQLQEGYSEGYIAKDVKGIKISSCRTPFSVKELTNLRMTELYTKTYDRKVPVSPELPSFATIMS